MRLLIILSVLLCIGCAENDDVSTTEFLSVCEMVPEGFYAVFPDKIERVAFANKCEKDMETLYFVCDWTGEFCFIVNDLDVLETRPI